MRELLKVHGIDVNAKTDTNREDIIKAFEKENLGPVEELLAAPGIEGSTPLYMAAMKGHTEIVRELLMVPGVEVNTQGDKGSTALIIAALFGRKEVVRELLRTPGLRSMPRMMMALQLSCRQLSEAIQRLSVNCSKFLELM